MIDLNRHAPLTNPRLVGQTAEEAEQFRTTSNNFANNQVSSVQKEFMSPDDDYECCPNCNRKFFSGRLQLHLKSCKEGKPLKPIKGKPLPKANQTLRSEGGLGANRATETTPRESQREGSAVYQDEEDFEPSFGNQRKSPIIMNVKSPPIRGAKAQEYEEYEVRGNNRNVGYSDNEEGEEEVEENSPNKDNMEENENPVGDEERVPCGVCGRNFHPDRVEKHEKACKKSNKKRPVFDTTKQRMVAEQGELVKKGVSKPPKKAPVQKEKPVLEATGGHGEEQEGGEQTKKVPAWKSQHENFIKNIKFNRKLKEMEAKGEDTSHLVAPTMANDDYVPCPYCSRKFAPATAERHIPKCKNTFNRPKPPPKALKIERPEDVGPRNERIDRSKTQFILRKSTTSNSNKKSPEKGEITPSSQGNCTINMSEKGISNRSPQSAFSTGNYERNLEELMKEKSTPGGHRGSLKKMSSVEFSGKQNGMVDQRKQEMIDNMGMGHEIKMPERKNFRSQSPGAKEEKKVFMEAMPKKDELLKNYQGVGARASNYATETCPHCQRNFAKHAAERHIPVCRSMASRLPKKGEAEMMGTTKGKMLGTTMAFRNRSIEREEQGSQRLGNTGNHTNYDQFGSQEKARHSDKPPLPAKKSLGDTEGYSAEKPPLKPKMFSTGSNFCTSCGCKSLKTHKFCGNCGMKKGV